jgi:hypothetical protein
MNDHTQLPDRTRHLFADYPDPDGLTELYPEFVIGRILEEGDSADLEWLFRRFEESEIVGWLDKYGSRQLSRRSRSFWSLVLEHPIDRPPPINVELWPL